MQAIRAASCRPGLAFNPATPLDVLDWLIDDIDLILIMSVNPGFGGQSFIDSALRKTEQSKKKQHLMRKATFKMVLLVTWLYKLTVSAKDYNLASVIGILIFAISAAFSLLAYTRSASFKEGTAK